jgi:hypothetical protein
MIRAIVMKPTLLLVQLVVALLLHTPALYAAVKDEGPVAWTVTPDPLPWKVEAPASVGSLPIPGFSSVNFPSTQSPFFAIVTPGKNNGPNEMKMFDLRTMSQVGSVARAEIRETQIVRVSPWGNHLALIDNKAESRSVRLWTVGQEQIVPSIVVSEEKNKIEAIDFVGKNQIITLREFRENNRNVRYWQIWDVTNGKEVLRFHHNEEYSNKWVSFTPGRRYMIFQLTENGYHVLFFDLTTGKLAGKIVQQEPKALWGQCGHITVSPDGKEAALIWRLKKDGVLAKIQRFDLVHGTKIGEHIMKEELVQSEMGLLAGGMKTFQFLPDGRGWLVSGHQIVARETGVIVYAIPPSPRSGTDTIERRFVDGYHVTEFTKGRKALRVVQLPQAELDAAFAKPAKQQ